jgi:tetratricopeptide (TPR) repeat protein
MTELSLVNFRMKTLLIFLFILTKSVGSNAQTLETGIIIYDEGSPPPNRITAPGMPSIIPVKYDRYKTWKDYENAESQPQNYTYSDLIILEFTESGNDKFNLEDYSGAIADYSIAIKLNPNNAVLHCNRGLAKYHLENYSGAIADYNKAIELDPNYSTAYLNRGVVKNKLQDYRGAIADYSKAIELDPKSSATYYNRGLVKHKMQDLNGACLDWSKAGELGDEDAYDLIKKYCN